MNFSIILPYYNKKLSINLVLKSISLQDFAKQNIEVVIIDDGSDDSLDDLIIKYSPKVKIVYNKIEHTGNRGYVRNLGASIASNEMLIFLDSDMVLEKDVLLQFMRNISEDNKEILLGTRHVTLKFDYGFLDEVVLENEFDILRNIPAWEDDRTMALKFMEKSGIKYDGGWQLLFSHCFCIRKRCFKDVGGFDDVFSKNWGAEDIELGYRLWKNGSSFKVVPDVKCYHLHHPSDINSNILSLKKNYSIFIKKHLDWRVELVTREFEYWPKQTILLQEKIKEKTHLIKTVKDIRALIERIPDKTLLVGIDNEDLINCDKVSKCFNPEGVSSSPKVLNILGLETEFNDNEFNLAIVSENYKKLNIGVWEMILDESSRISRQIILLSDENGDGLLFESPKIRKRDKKYLSFVLMNETNWNMNRYHFLNLAIAMHKLGINVNVNVGYDPYEEVEVNKGYLSFESPSKLMVLKKIINKDVHFFGDKVPSIMEFDIARYTNRAIGQRIFWEDVSYINQHKYFDCKGLDKFKLILFKRTWEEQLYGNGIRKQYLPAGIDTDKINKYSSLMNKKSDQFTFLWADQRTNSFSNIELVISSFSEAFSGSKNVRIVVLLPTNTLDLYRSEYYGETQYLMIKNGVDHTLRMCNHYKNTVLEKYGDRSNIQLVNKDLSDERVTEYLANSDCYISGSSLLHINPLVLEAYALGKTSIVSESNNLYDGYIPDDKLIKVKSNRISALNNDGVIENVYTEEEDYGRYCLVNIPDKECLKNAFLYAVKNAKEINCENSGLKDFKEKFSWMEIANIAEKLIF